MPLFEDRERAAERQFEQEHEFAFRVVSRRNRFLGRWAAGHLGLIGEDAERYATSVVDAGIGQRDERAVIEKVYDDLVAGGVPIAERDVRSHLQAFGVKARAELLDAAGRET